MQHTLLQPGRNCQRIDRADKVSVLIDADAYFRALDQALDLARETVYIVGWEIDSRMALLCEPGRAQAHFLGQRLNQIAARQNVRISILTWDFAMFYALERQFLPIFELGWSSHRGVRFAMDGEHPFGASHHQKIVVIDDALGFVGGLDLTKRRWDAPRHLAHDECRIDPDGKPYPPFHDIQMAVGGPAAKALGQLARERWRRCLGRLPVAPRDSRQVWPESLRPVFRNVDVGWARTEPAFKGRPEVREVEALFLDSIAAARHCIYIENQYFTSPRIEKALSERLREPNGPEVVIVLPKHPVGWLEESVMGVLGVRVVESLRRADEHGRLGIYFPVAPGAPDGSIKVHSKFMVVDDALVRVGSANLNNRSMGLDTECDLAVETGDDPAAAAVVGELRNRLVAEHLRVPVEALAGLPPTGQGLLDRIRALAAEHQGLEPIDVAHWAQFQTPSLEMVLPLDPERPIQMDRLMDAFFDEDQKGSGRSLKMLVLVIALLAALALSWHFTPLREYLNVKTMTSWVNRLDQGPMTPLLMLGLYVGGSLVFVPVSLLIAATALAFPPLPGMAYALGGSLAASAVLYWLGRILGRGPVRRLAGRRLNRLSRRLARMGVLSVALLRLLPVAPFSVVNLVSGASHLSFGQFMLGTLIGMAPGIMVLTLFTDRLKAVIMRPGWGSLGLFLAVTAILTVVALRLRKRLEREERAEAACASGENP